jgi:hypothetical protein
MKATPDPRQQILQLIASLEARIADCQARLPAHSIPPTMLAELDDLDEQLAEARSQLQSLTDKDQQMD